MDHDTRAGGDNPQRIRSEAAFAPLCVVGPTRAPGKTNRHGLNRGRDRAANRAPWRIVMTRRVCDERTRTYVAFYEHADLEPTNVPLAEGTDVLVRTEVCVGLSLPASWLD